MDNETKRINKIIKEQRRRIRKKYLIVCSTKGGLQTKLELKPKVLYTIDTLK